VLVAVEIRLTPSGRGVFAREPIEAGRIVAVFGGAAIPGPILRALPSDHQQRALQVADDVYLLTERDAGVGHLINHSCDPSCRMAGEVTLVAARDIAPGEQITFDYATTDSTPYDEFECVCGEPNCRGKVTGEDWMDPALQRRYRGWFSPYLQRRIDRIRAGGSSADD
jgi:SET domain-containing protein